MESLNIPLDWIVERASKENKAIQKASLNAISSIFSSKEKKDAIRKETNESLGKMKMLREIMETFTKTN